MPLHLLSILILAASEATPYRPPRIIPTVTHNAINYDQSLSTAARCQLLHPSRVQMLSQAL